jgi:hypothetical protein
MSSAENPIDPIEEGGDRATLGEPDSEGRGARLANLAKGVAANDEATLSLVILRDVAIVSALLSLFAAAEAWAATSELALATLLSVVDGLLVGAAIAGLLHEWGHFAGARLAGGHAPLKPIRGFLPIFAFDYKNNDARAFDWMSIGGNVGDIGVVLLFFVALPLSSPGATALIAGAFGFAVFAGAIEFPVIKNARAGMTGIEALGTIPKGFFRRYSRWGMVAALVAFVVL